MKDALLAFVLGTAMFAAHLGYSSAQDKPLPRKQSGDLSSESAIGRAFQRVRILGFTEATVFAAPHAEEDGYVVVFAHSDGDVSFFQGGSSPDKDQMLTIEKTRVALFESTIHRMRGP